MKQLFAFPVCLIIFFSASAQKTPEFPKGWVMYLEEYHGAATNFTVSPDLFISALRLVPQVTVVPGHLRLGGTMGAVFNNKKLEGTFGPNLAVNLFAPDIKKLGSAFNAQLQAEYLWGTINNQRLIGGLINIEIGQLAIIGLSVHRDYVFNYWWFQGGFGYNLLHKKIPRDPMSGKQ
jgi:hypothetical protein